MATETVLINFEVDYSELTNAQTELGKTGKIDAKGFNDIQNAIDNTAKDTQGLIRQFKDVAGASIKMGKSLEDAFSGGVQDALDQAGVSVDEFAAALKKTNAPAITIKKELQQLKEAMARMKAEGKDTGAEFDSMRKKAGQLSDAIADANAEIKNAGSDTRGIDNVVGSISALAGGYAAVQGAAALFGEENEDLQKALLKVNGAMAIAQGIQQISNALQKEGALAKLADSVATGAQTAATTLYTFVTNGATVAARAFKIALLATGIGAVVVLIIALANAMSSYGDKTKEATEDMDSFNSKLEFQNELLDDNLRRINFANKIAIEKAKQRGASEKEINDLVISGLKEQAKALRDQAQEQQRQLNESLKNNKLSAEAQNKIIDDITAKKRKANDLDDEATLKSEEFKTGVALDGIKKRNEAADKAIKALEERLEREQKAFEDYYEKIRIAQFNANKKIEAGAEAYRKKEFEKNKEFYKNLLNQFKKQKEDEKKVQDDAESDFYINKWEQVDIDEAKDKAATDKRIANAQRYLAIAQQTAGLLGQIANIQSERDNAEIIMQRKLVEEKLKAGAITEKAAEQQRARIDKLERKYRQEAAIREKKAATFQAVLAIPQAFLQGLQTNIALAVIMGALAAANAAIIISKPIPKFFRGKKDSYEGPGVVGDMGTELVERNGRMFLYTKPTQTYLSAKDKVYTAAETRQILHNTNISTTVKQQPAAGFDYDRLGKAIPKSSINISIDREFISESVAAGLTRTNYMDRRYSSR